MSNKYLNNINKTISHFLCDDNSVYDEQGRIVQCGRNLPNYKNTINVEYNENEAIATHTHLWGPQDPDKASYEKITYDIKDYETMTEGIRQYAAMVKEDVYNNKVENKLQKTIFYDEEDDCYVDHIDYMNVPSFSTVREYRDGDNDSAISSVEYWKRGVKEQHKDFEVSYEEGQYNINKYQDGKIIDTVDLPTLVDNYYNNPACMRCGESIRIADWKGEIQHQGTNYEFKGACKLLDDGTYDLSDLLHKSCDDNGIDYDEIDGFDGEAKCQNCRSEIYEPDVEYKYNQM